MSKYKIPEDYYPTIKEIAFRDHYFPALMRGDKEIALEWLKEIAIRPNTKVNVLDDNTGEIIFSVPPLVRSPTTLIGSNLWDTLDLIKSHMQRGHTADKLLSSELREVFHQQEYTEEEIKQWLFIYERYGVVPAGAVNENSTSRVAEEEEEWD